MSKIVNVEPKRPSNEFLPKSVADSLEIIDTNLSFEESKKVLAKILLNEGFITTDAEEYKLASGRESRFYCDIKKALTNDKVGKAIIALFLSLMEHAGIDSQKEITVASNGAGGALVVGNISVSRENTNGLVDRLVAKEYGTGDRFVGEIKDNQDIVLIDDVLTTGGNMRHTISELDKRGAKPKALFVVVNRSDETGNLITHVDGVPVFQIFTKADFNL